MILWVLCAWNYTLRFLLASSINCKQYTGHFTPPPRLAATPSTRNRLLNLSQLPSPSPCPASPLPPLPLPLSAYSPFLPPSLPPPNTSPASPPLIATHVSVILSQRLVYKPTARPVNPDTPSHPALSGCLWHLTIINFTCRQKSYAIGNTSFLFTILTDWKSDKCLTSLRDVSQNLCHEWHLMVSI